MVLQKPAGFGTVFPLNMCEGAWFTLAANNLTPLIIFIKQELNPRAGCRDLQYVGDMWSKSSSLNAL